MDSKLRGLAALLAFAAIAAHAKAPDAAGIQFTCESAQVLPLEQQLQAYFAELGVEPKWVRSQRDLFAGTLRLTLDVPSGATDTLTLARQPKWRLRPDTVSLPTLEGPDRKVKVVSRKEIVLALLHPGRLTEFPAEACSVQALVEHVEIRQNIVAWTQYLGFSFPDGEPAQWNPLYWSNASPGPFAPLREAVQDMFLNQEMYSVGCYTAAKMVYMQGVLDYYDRVRPNQKKLSAIEQQLMRQGAHFKNVEPGAMWQFYADSDPAEASRPGTLLQFTAYAGARHVVPGDWAYLRNTDPVSERRVGYEGSNIIYMGQGLFEDYYTPHNDMFPYTKKLNEVYQWRHGVLGDEREIAVPENLTAAKLAQLARAPEQGGLQLPWRAGPRFF